MHGITMQQDLANRVRWSGGFTWSPFRPTPTTGYMVGVRSVWTTADPAEPLPLDRFQRVIHEIDLDPFLFLGGWLDETDGTVYYDLSMHFTDRNFALKQARSNGELAIYDLSTGESIPVPYEAEYVCRSGLINWPM